ncbi:alpha-L-rhamnosidase [Clostridium grantii]|uniref:alpha-L-rhamnosidase n=1 Tax=Clostridium grantii DSM 8605 TaxID=1121316 RepID=A0A1M5VBM1_9CLOT|nr:alpha-L-rhamnosidase [Clostridium grantii]SHH72538.1 alpha-L-rhamnosidase [Clostridium grantii DSM 8605]
MLFLEKIRCEYLENPIGIGENKPRFNWIIESDQTKVEQVSYQLQVSNDVNFIKILWDTEVVSSSNSTHVVYEGPELQSCTQYFYRVKIWDNKGEESAWSEIQIFETAMMNNQEWKGIFISADDKNAPNSSKGKHLRHEFNLKGNIIFARIYATALGIYELHLNGKRVGESLLTPGWTNYKKRLQYQTYDVTEMIKEGRNAIGAILGCGWYKGELGWNGKRNTYGKHTALLFQMLVRYEDGTEELIVSNEEWKSAEGPIVYSELYHGEIYDARFEQQGWSEPNFYENEWKKVYPVKQDFSIIMPQDGVPVKKQESIKPIELIITPKGETVIDFGQNIAGWVKFKVKGKSGDRVLLKHAEVLDQEGNFYTANLRRAKATIEYTLKGGAEEVFEPHFTFQGFRYVQIVEYPGTIDLENIEAIVIHSNMEQTGDFKCSYPLINQLAKNILWGLKGNFVDLPTDCPQRDERLGWTGDAQVFMRTACFLMDTTNFFKKWLRDLKSEQFEDGAVPYVIPDILSGNFACGAKEIEKQAGATGWGDAAVICPWTIYECYGDKRILEEQYESMKAWINYIKENAQEGLIWNKGFHFGDWVALDAKEGSYFGATPNELTATAFYAYSTEIMIKVAKILKQEEDEGYFTQLHQSILEAFKKEFYTSSGSLTARTQTGHILALMFNLVSDEDRTQTVDSLIQLIKENQGHLTTGFLGTPYICKVLSENGRLKEAYDLLLKDDYPSWLYQVTKGATTIWEHWDGIKLDGTMWSEDMNSFNHYAYGAIGEWIYTVIGGLDTDSDKPGYKHSIIKPQPGGGLTYAELNYTSLYGQIAIKWEMKGRRMNVGVIIPHNTTADVILINANNEIIETHVVGSGKYNFEYDYFID